MPPGEPDVLVALLRRIERRLDAIERRLDGRPALARGDVERLQRLLPAVAAALGSEPFLASELSEHAGPRIASAGMSPRQIGRLLRRSMGTVVGGLMVERLAVEAGACVWRVVATS